jgi:predicted outer membrane lipoprotein
VFKLKTNAKPFGLSGIVSRMLLSLFIVYGTYNPSGRSLYHCAIADGLITPRLLIGLVILGTYVSLLYATWVVIGFAGMLLVVAFCVATALMLEQIDLISLADWTTIRLVSLTTLAFTMGWGMSFSLLFARLTGILHARASIHQQ